MRERRKRVNKNYSSLLAMNYIAYTTDYNKGKYFEATYLKEGKADATHIVNVYPECKYQVFKGFGGAFTEASAYNFSKLDDDSKEEVLNAYFGDGGINYTLGRTHINSCDFALGNYTYIEEGDTELATFNIDRDRKYVIPMIKKALDKKKISFLASPWSPPAFMKTNGDMNNGGSLKKEYYECWARYMAKYIKAFRQEGINITMVSAQNEPMAVQTWDSCYYTSEEERNFVGDFLGPILKEEGLSDVEILIWDHNKDKVYERTKEVLSDSKTKEFVGGIAFHWYAGDHFEAVALVREKYPDKDLYFTEGCVEFSRFKDSDDVYKAEMYAHDIIGNMNAGMNGFIDWNLLLDANGGPNHKNNYCAAPLQCREDFKGIEKRLAYFYIGQFSKYIMPGAVRIATTRYTDSIETTALVNPDGKKVIVLLNRTDKDHKVCIHVNEAYFNVLMEAHTITTLVEE